MFPGIGASFAAPVRKSAYRSNRKSVKERHQPRDNPNRLRAIPSGILFIGSRDTRVSLLPVVTKNGIARICKEMQQILVTATSPFQYFQRLNLLEFRDKVPPPSVFKKITFEEETQIYNFEYSL